MSFRDYDREAARTRNTDTPPQQRATNAALGLAGEAGEVADLIKKNVFHGRPLDVPDLLAELGDVLWYLSWLADLHGSSLEEVASRNIDKLRRRHPDGFDPSYHGRERS